MKHSYHKKKQSEDELELARFRRLTLSCWYLTGPTASGKSRTGITLARRLGAEIISLDSMAIYREMDIGTAKMLPEERGGIPHHMIDIVDPSEEYSLAQYVRDASNKIDEIQLRGKAVLFVGGTPLYLKGMLRGVFEGPPTDHEFRAQLLRKMEGNPPELLHKLLKKVDPATAKRLHPNDVRRIVRALEVYEKTGKPISFFQKQFEFGTPASQCQVYVLQTPREELYARINKRVDRMIYEGFLDEVRLLAERKVPISKTARQALGYKELFDYIEGKMKYGQAVDLIKQNTRNFAKRQETWFRSLVECRFTSSEKPEFEGIKDENEEESEQEQQPAES
ncbi:MAG: tRNA (adenosine(37)-N6)-dimethylallyltransferase MiaA [Planctomycetaceae bacterium]|jgi:tRNA dimethylallyltransferase|nr:tRNA (adenosine(37)-N6)-dimethylallyltransferase MiaA [Planctomycetaceae bacterium]